MESLHEISLWILVLVNFSPETGEVVGVITAPADSEKTCRSMLIPRYRSYATPGSAMDCFHKNYMFPESSIITEHYKEDSDMI